MNDAFRIRTLPKNRGGISNLADATNYAYRTFTSADASETDSDYLDRIESWVNEGGAGGEVDQ